MGRRRPPFVEKVRQNNPDKHVAVWFQDEARIGQQGTLTRVWAERGSRPHAVRQTEYEWAYVFGAADPMSGKSSALIAPTVGTKLMGDHLKMICEEAGEDTHVVLVLDGAGWHKAKALKVPVNMTLLFLPPHSPELMPMERVWAWMRQHDLSNRVFVDADEIDRACAESWNKLTPERIKTITHEAWLTRAE